MPQQRLRMTAGTDKPRSGARIKPTAQAVGKGAGEGSSSEGAKEKDVRSMAALDTEYPG